MKTQDARATENFTLIRKKKIKYKKVKRISHRLRVKKKSRKSSTRGKVCERENLKKNHSSKKLRNIFHYF